MRLLGLLLALALPGCALFPLGSGSSSYVAGVAPTDAPVLAEALAGVISQQLPPLSTTLALQKAPADNALTPVLEAALARAGFALADPAQAVPNTHTVRYQVTPLDNGLLLRVQIDATTEASRWYRRDSAGQLTPGSPLTVRLAAQ
jgi:hypothetical protein